MNKDSKIYVAGHTGLAGSAIMRRLLSLGYGNIVTKTHSQLDLTRQREVEDFFKQEAPEYVFLAAGKVGGILANSKYPAEFIYINSMIQSNIVHSAYKTDVKKLLFLGSSCIYPRDSLQPIKEEYLLSGKLESTNEAYAIAKIAGLKMCEYYKSQYGANFISCMPTNLYGQNDNFDLENSHVLAAFIRKFHEAKEMNSPEVIIWGTGTPLREFLYVDDLADACVFLMNNYDGLEHINIGSGEEVSIKELALLVKDVVGYSGELKFGDNSMDGTPRKIIDVTKLNNLGWSAKTSLEDGLVKTYEWFVKNIDKAKGM